MQIRGKRKPKAAARCKQKAKRQQQAIDEQDPYPASTSNTSEVIMPWKRSGKSDLLGSSDHCVSDSAEGETQRRDELLVAGRRYTGCEASNAALCSEEEVRKQP